MLLALPAAAQQLQSGPDILIIESERLYPETLYGRRLARELEMRASEVQAENDRIAETLTAEERSLTLRRPDMTPEEFRAEADAFDEKVQEVRRVRDAKNAELQSADAAARAEFEDRVQSVIADMMLERGALMVMDRRNVIMSIRAVNITDDLIVRIDAALGDGTR
ncbi:OmpH family outer membrane protein [Cognatiyoonia sp. IB215182]|uniref:OmpH family outer membrane protein n=1 Tax=Cognatiyoonia sp. IB215182 TaxID=3097353 RepID=UPI002A23D565|nr:OmpH family outer membrane protein [Cognatiyoonia sp. IB215182]